MKIRPKQKTNALERESRKTGGEENEVEALNAVEEKIISFIKKDSIEEIGNIPALNNPNIKFTFELESDNKIP